MGEEEGGHLDRKEAKQQSGTEAACEALHSQPGRFDFTSTEGSSTRVGSGKSNVYEKFFWQLRGGCIPEERGETQGGQRRYFGGQARGR